MAKSYKLVVLTNAAPANDQEFNEWYDMTHLPDILKIPGFVAAKRFRMITSLTSDPIYRYCAIYELESDDPMAAVAEMMTKAGTADMPISAAMHPVFYGGLFEEAISFAQPSG